MDDFGKMEKDSIAEKYAFAAVSGSGALVTVRNWIKQAGRDVGKRTDGLTGPEQEELKRLRREVKQLQLEREILSKAAAWFARETDVVPPKSSRS